MLPSQYEKKIKRLKEQIKNLENKIIELKETQKKLIKHIEMLMERF
jgi:septal ring factor EnvC (AmiA/AmiB activator)